MDWKVFLFVQFVVIVLFQIQNEQAGVLPPTHQRGAAEL
jgi:hypothetical protein